MMQTSASALALAACIFLNVHPSAQAANASAGAAKVMIVGVAHLVWRRDVHNSALTDNPLSPKRQAQIAAVVDRLAQFHPTKVLVEESMGNPVFAQRYRRFLAGRYTLPPSEDYQFGYRLAAKSGNSTIYPVDTFGSQYIDDSSAPGKRIDTYLNAHFGQVSTPAFQAFLARSDALERHGTYLDLLRYINTDAAIRANASVYSVLLGMGREADNAGSAWVSQWYARNTYIFSNILSVVRPGDRVVVIFGQGHEYILREFARLNPSLAYVDPLTYLK